MINERIKRILLLLDEKQIRRIKRTDKEYVYLFACCLDKDENVTVTVKCSNNGAIIHCVLLLMLNNY